MDAAQDVVLYRGRRLGPFLWTMFFVALTFFAFAVGFAGIILGDKDVRHAWLVVPVAALCAFLASRFGRNVIWPPQLEISRVGVRWTHFDTADASYSWDDIAGPQLKKVRLRNDILYVHFVVKSTGREVDLLLNDLGGATYDEVKAVVSSAREGKLISP